MNYTPYVCFSGQKTVAGPLFKPPMSVIEGAIDPIQRRVELLSIAVLSCLLRGFFVASLVLAHTHVFARSRMIRMVCGNGAPVQAEFGHPRKDVWPRSPLCALITLHVAVLLRLQVRTEDAWYNFVRRRQTRPTWQLTGVSRDVAPFDSHAGEIDISFSRRQTLKTNEKGMWQSRRKREGGFFHEGGVW